MNSDRPQEDSAASLRDVIAIDGPSGAGKSTVARRLAQRLGCTYLDTGAMYRAVTWHLLTTQAGQIDPSDVARHLGDLAIELTFDGHVLVDGRDVSSHLRSQEVESRVSMVSAVPEVRARMRDLQRALARAGRLVAEGRDMGSVVFPAARWKFFLDAAPRERARRRREDFLAQGRDVSERDVLDEIEVRDRLDCTRSDAPLVRAPGARVVDTTAMHIDFVVETLAQIVQADATGEAAS